ncbi:MAG: HEAT repeat domain-containing protein [Chloroflexota bacterium]|nr:HEAT repeat domain-containing protein [Chloroflexota bacterium]
MEIRLRDIVARWRSAAALGGDLRGDAVGVLMDFLNDPHPFVRWHASEALAETARALQRRRTLGDGLWARRSRRPLTFEGFWTLLSQAMREGDARCRAAIADGLGLWGHPRAIDPLAWALREDDAPLVRVSAADALGRIGDREAADSLGQALTDESLWVRSAAARALGKVAAPEAVDALQEALSDADPLVRRSVVAALGRIPEKRARRALVACLQDEDLAVRWYAARGLGEIGQVENVVPLEALLEDEGVLFDRSIGDMAQSAIEVIERHSQSPWHWLRKQMYIVRRMVADKMRKG